MEMQGRVVWMCGARGFKDHGEYDAVKGFEIQKLGHIHQPPYLIPVPIPKWAS